MFRTWITVGFCLLGQAGAAGILGGVVSNSAVQQTPFCQKYGCGEPFIRGREIQFPYNRYQGLKILRESSDPASRVVQVQLWVRNEGLNASDDRAAFQDVQRLALGYIPYTGRVEACYGAQLTKTLVDAPDERTLAVTCEAWESDTEFDVKANPMYLARQPAATIPTTGPTKLNRWWFRNCNAQGSVTPFLQVARASRCDLMIEIKGELSSVVRAEFQYELEYYQNGQHIKKLLPEKEYWWPGRQQGKFDPVVSQQGRTVTANISLAVKSVPGRQVTSLNTIAKLTFANGTTKTAYEPLPVR